MKRPSVTLLMGLGMLLLSGTAVQAGKYNPVLSIGSPAPAFASLKGTDGNDYSLADFKQAKVVVIAFTCNSCPYAIDYESRLMELAKRYKENRDVAIVAINSNLIPADSLEAMKDRADELKLPYPYVSDVTQQTAREFGALRTPEFFVLNAKRKIVYMGSFDDNTDADRVTKQYLADAVSATLAGNSPAVEETPPIGCLIRLKRVRRTRSQ